MFSGFVVFVCDIVFGVSFSGVLVRVFRFWVSRFEVFGFSRFEVRGYGIGVRVSRLGVSSSVFQVQGFGFGIRVFRGLRFRVRVSWFSGLRVFGFRSFRGSGF